ncbi:hypothetical protein L6164_033167 [Bauhinia variegata]|uniref:Uncharacterized protein n=1 Tax=Bauhinia variegata TaxID=167791 RepID=A0ACB9KR01_BAUVA|nr:hypothetical protein L6164_033167 [Bauhinia variegata]
MDYLQLFLILVLASPWAASTLIEEAFMECMFHSNHSEFLETIYTPSSPSYSNILEFSQQNPRWLNSSHKPLLIITPIQASEIQAAIVCSRKQGLQIRIRSGGHDYEGLSYLCDTPFILIDLINLRSIEINLEDETAWVEAGATLGELYYEIFKASKIHGFPAGVCPSVGVGGHFSGGGFGNMVRKHGLAADKIINAYLIDANGKVLDRKTMGEDLFWAIRGGGSTGFGVILAWKIKLVRVPSVVTGFTIRRTLEEGATKLVHRWQHLAHELNEDLYIRIYAHSVGGGSSGEPKTVEASFNSIFLGKKERFITTMKESFPELGLSAEDCIEMSWIRSVLYFANLKKDDPLEVLLNRIVSPKIFFKAKSDFVMDPMPETGLEGVWKIFLEEETKLMVILEPFGGKMAQILETETAFPHRKGNLYNIQYYLPWEESGAEAFKRNLHSIRKLYKYMTPYVSKSPRAAYINYRDLDLGTNKGSNTSFSEASAWGKKYFKGNFKRLAQIKTKVDPDNFFRNEQSIPLLY